MKSAKFAIVLFLSLFVANNMYSQDFFEEDPLELKIYPLEVPYNFSSLYSYWGMNQLVENSETWAIFVHETFGNLLINSGCNDLFAFFFLGIYNITVEQHLPLGSEWMIQEAHRSVLGLNRIDSYNTVYDFNFKVSEKKVTNISDNELAEFHDKHPVEFIHAVTASSELMMEKSKEIKKNYFYSGRSLRFILPNLWLNQINVFWNMQSSSLSTINDTIDNMNDEETDIDERDFCGPEFTTWVYELYHSDEDYSNRGTHPSGNGYDRYISYTDLSSEELNYLSRVTYLMLLNFLSPQMLGINRFVLSEQENIYCNFMFLTYLTPFGYTVDFNFLGKLKSVNLNLTYHSYMNHEKYFPGIDIELYRLPVKFLRRRFFLGMLISVWNQPKDLDFFTEDSMIGGMMRSEVVYQLNEKFELFTEAGFKTKGWVAGQLSLENEYSIGLGLNVLMY